MRIERGYALSQFIDWLCNLEHEKKKQFLLGRNREHYTNEILVEHLQAIEYYNDLLKQPLTKDMFVNDVRYPMTSEYRSEHGSVPIYPTECYQHDLKQWQEAEGKVIFEGWIGQYKKELGFESFQVSDGRNHIEFYKDGDISLMDNELQEYEIKTIGDLFEATKGQLITKNLEI